VDLTYRTQLTKMSPMHGTGVRREISTLRHESQPGGSADDDWRRKACQ